MINNQGVIVVKNSNKQLKISSIERNFWTRTHGDIETHPSLKHQIPPGQKVEMVLMWDAYSQKLMLKFYTGSHTHNEMSTLVGIMLTWHACSHAKIYVRHGSQQNAALVLMWDVISL